LWKLGMTRTVVETDWTGDFITSGQCWSTARDFGRFGLFYLADGVWNGERILPEGWSKYVSTLAPAQPASRARGGAGYGAQFWIYSGLEGLPDVALYGHRLSKAILRRSMIAALRWQALTCAPE
jgi:CubicO group peptidase (beta-lactamase class C family)